MRAAVTRATDYKTLATDYNDIAHYQAAESAAVWTMSMAACASAPRFTVVRTPAARGLVNLPSIKCAPCW